MTDFSDESREAAIPSPSLSLKEGHYLDLYKIVVDEIHKYHSLHQRRLAYFSGLVASLLGASILGLVN